MKFEQRQDHGTHPSPKTLKSRDPDRPWKSMQVLLWTHLAQQLASASPQIQECHTTVMLHYVLEIHEKIAEIACLVTCQGEKTCGRHQSNPDVLVASVMAAHERTPVVFPVSCSSSRESPQTFFCEKISKHIFQMKSCNNIYMATVL